MGADSRNVFVIENSCNICGGEAISIYHQNFPELRVGGQTVCEAAERLVNRLDSALDVVADPIHREPVRQAIADVKAFMNDHGGETSVSDLSRPSTFNPSTGKR